MKRTSRAQHRRLLARATVAAALEMARPITTPERQPALTPAAQQSKTVPI